MIFWPRAERRWSCAATFVFKITQFPAFPSVRSHSVEISRRCRRETMLICNEPSPISPSIAFYRLLSHLLSNDRTAVVCPRGHRQGVWIECNSFQVSKSMPIPMMKWAIAVRTCLIFKKKKECAKNQSRNVVIKRVADRRPEKKWIKITGSGNITLKSRAPLLPFQGTISRALLTSVRFVGHATKAMSLWRPAIVTIVTPGASGLVGRMFGLSFTRPIGLHRSKSGSTDMESQVTNRIVNQA